MAVWQVIKNLKKRKFLFFVNQILPAKNDITGFQKSLKRYLIFPIDLKNVIYFCQAIWERGEPICFSSGSEEFFFDFVKV